jgi:hypothetical protein
MRPDRDRPAEWEAVPRCLLYTHGVVCGAVMVSAVAAGGWLLADAPRWTWWAYGGLVLPAAVLGAGWTAHPVLSRLVRRWPVLGSRTTGCDGRGDDGTA